MNGDSLGRVAMVMVSMLAGFGLGCTPAASGDDLVQQVAAVSAAPSTVAGASAAPAPSAAAHAPLYEHPSPGPTAHPAIAPLAAVSAAQHAGHTQNQADGKTLPIASGVAVAAVPSAAIVAKQASYLQQWQQAKAGWASLSPDQQEAQRAALKTAVVGQ